MNEPNNLWNLELSLATEGGGGGGGERIWPTAEKTN